MCKDIVWQKACINSHAIARAASLIRVLLSDEQYLLVSFRQDELRRASDMAVADMDVFFKVAPGLL